jgi:hypothetical protein
MASNFLQLLLALLVTKLLTFYRRWGTFTNDRRSTLSWHKFSVCPHTVLHNTLLLPWFLSLPSVYVPFRASSLKCCYYLLYVVKCDAYPARFTLLGSLNCKKKQSLNFSYISHSDKRILKIHYIVLLIIQRQMPHEKSSGNYKDNIKKIVRSTVRQEQA